MAGGIDNAVNVANTFTYDPVTAIFDFPTAVANCNVTYVPATGAATTDAARGGERTHTW